MRSFVAVMPPPEALEDLERFVEPRRDVGAERGLRWTLPTQWHLTLAFMPDVPDHALDELRDRLSTAASRIEAFDLRISGSGAFPNPGRAKVLWMGVEGGDAHLARLAAGVRAAANKAGAAPEGGSFHPHLTLARLRRPAEVTRWLRLFDAYSGPRWRAESLVLMRSHLGQGPRGKPRYEVLEEFTLTPMGAS